MKTIDQMTIPEKCREICGYLGIEWDTHGGWYGHFSKNPDFARDPVSLLREIISKFNKHQVEDFVMEYCDGDNALVEYPNGYRESYNLIRIDFILDQTGLLLNAALEWFRNK